MTYYINILILIFCTISTNAFGIITWSAPQNISTPLTNASDPQVVIDANNNINAIWLEGSNLMASSRPSGGSWSAPTRISTLLLTASSPKLGIDGSGNVTALWIENGIVKSAIQPLAGVWGLPIAVSLTGASSPALAVNAAGNAVALWVRGGVVESSIRSTLGTWGLTSTRSAANSDNPDIAINGNNAIATWHTISSGSDFIVTSNLTVNTSTWATNKNVFNATAAIRHNYPKVNIDSNGNAMIAWFRYNLVNSNTFQNTQLLSSTLTFGAAAWTLPSIASSLGLRDPADLQIKMVYDISGNSITAWTNSYSGDFFNIETAQKVFGGSWPDYINPQIPSLYSFDLDLAIAGETALMVSMTWDGISAIAIYSQETSAANPGMQAWTIPNEISSSGNNGYPVCGISINGTNFNAVAAWIHYDGANSVIQASTGSSTAISAPSNVSATQQVTNYGIYQDFYNTITWSPSSDPSIIQYNIFRNGIFVNPVTPDTLQFIDHNADAGATVTYGVAAVTSDYRQSAISTYTLVP